MQDAVIFTTHKHTHRTAAAEQRNGISALSILLHICCMGVSLMTHCSSAHTSFQGMAAAVTTAAS
jgi:hypothetical protein